VKLSNGRQYLFFVITALFVAEFPSVAVAQGVSLGWNPSTSTNVAGYAVHYGTESGVYTTRIDAGTNTSASISGLSGGMTYYFVVSAYDAQAVESNPSNEAMFTVAAAPMVMQMVVGDGGVMTFNWSAVAGQSYQLQYKTDLNQTNWNNLGSVTTASNTLASAFDTIGPDNQRFYRLMAVP
jgi:hypothetical protein